MTNDEIVRHIDNYADCIYRYKIGMILLDAKTSERLDLLKLLKKKGNLDMKVRLNNKSKTMVRIITAPISKDLANKRRRKAKKENKHNPSKEYLTLLGWSIYITTIDEQELNFKDFMNIYSLRWRIETIFKSWKSNLNFAKYHSISENQFYVIILSRFLVAILFTNFFFKHCKKIILNEYKKHLSLMKTIKYLTRFPEIINGIKNDIITESKACNKMYIKKLSRYCCYDKRNDRKNFEQEFLELCPLS